MPGQIPGEQAERVEVEDLLRSPGRYNDRVVLVVGRLRSSDSEDLANNIFLLQDSFSSLRGVRVGQAWGSMNDLRFLDGRKVEVVGVFWDLSGMEYDPRLRNFPGAYRGEGLREELRYFIAVQSVAGVEEEPPPLDPKPDLPPPPPPDPNLPAASAIDLRELLKSPGDYVGKRIAVVGNFRGDNLYGDLSIRTKRSPRDFILKAADAAIWVTGRRPRGKDFDLDPKLRRDTGKWLRVSGVAREQEGVVYLQADYMELVPQPDDPALEPSEVVVEISESAKIPPEVVFSLPLEGERNISLDVEFKVQFSKDMNQASFDRNVDLLYADDTGRGNPFPQLKIDYHAPSRTLTVTPGTNLKPGKEIRLILYGEIRDSEGLPLAVAPGAPELAPSAAVVLSFFTAAEP
jgi:hypothetical protein